MAPAEDNKSTLLIVDDDPKILLMFALLFESEGFTVITAESAMQALELVKHRDFALVISDNKMPEMRGVELLALLKQQRPQLKSILLSGYCLDKEELPENSLIDAFIVKSIKPKELIQKVANLLNN